MTNGPRMRQTLDVAEAAELLGIGRSAAYEAARRGDLPTVRIGRRVLVPRAALEKMLDVPTPATSTTKPDRSAVA